MLESVDRYDKVLFLEDIDLPRPSLDVLVVLGCFQLDLFIHEFGVPFSPQEIFS